MSTEHPITPPPELVGQWHEQLWGDDCPVETATMAVTYIATQAARWGADAELEACCEWVERQIGTAEWGAELRRLRRPKPPSLAEQAETALLHLIHAAAPQMDTNEPAHYIRTALKRLQQLELENHG